MTALDQLAGPPAGAGAELDVSLSLVLGRLASQMAERSRFERRCAEAIRTVPIQPHTVAVVGGNAIIFDAGNVLGPGTGYNWALSRVTVAGLAAADVMSIYRGPAIALTVNPNNLLNVVTGAAPTWHPGRTACILNAGDTLVASGTGLTAASVTLTGEVIVMESWLLAHFLL